MNLENRIKRARYKANRKLIGERNLMKRLKISSKNEAGYSPLCPHARSWGFKDDWSLNLSHQVIDGNVYKDRIYNAINSLIIWNSIFYCRDTGNS